MKTKLPAQSVIFNSGFLISLSVSVFAVFLLALGIATADPPATRHAFWDALFLSKPGELPNVKRRKNEKNSNPVSDNSSLLGK